VKVYGRRLKTTTTSTTTTTPPPFQITSPGTWSSRRNETSSEEQRHFPRDQLSSQTESANTVNLGQMDLENFDIGKLLAAAGHSSSADPLAPTVVRFSAPSSDSQLDPAYLSKLIREQLGSDAQFQILPSSGKKDGESFKQIYGGVTQRFPKLEQHPSNSPPADQQQQHPSNSPNHQLQQQFRGGFKQAVDGPSQPAYSSPQGTPPPRNSPNTYPAQLVTHYDGRKAKEMNSGTHAYQSQNQILSPHKSTPSWSPPIQSTTAQFNPNQGNQIYPSTPKPVTYHQAPQNPGATRNFPLYPRNPAQSVKQSELVNLSGFPNPKPSSVKTPPPKGAPVKTSSLHNPVSSPNTQSQSGFHFQPVSLAGYSTLSQQMTAPDLTPAITGQYGDQAGRVSDKENYVTSADGSPFPTSDRPKYSTAFVRGFNDDEIGHAQPQKKYPQITSTRPPQPQREENGWKGSKEASSYASLGYSGQGPISEHPQPPSREFRPPEPSKSIHQFLPESSTFDVVKTNREEGNFGSKGTPGFDPSDFYQQNQPSRSPSQNYPSYAKSTHWNGNPPPDNYELVNPTPQPDYGPAAPLALAQYQSSDDSHTIPPPNVYGRPDFHAPQTESPSRVTKTIYVNLPPESPLTTTPRPYQRHVVLPQKHYKIVFIKAPTAPPPEEPEIEVTPAPETKTIIYVLHKKPETAKKVVITVPPPTTPASPDVYFIQYKDKKGEQENYREQDIKWEEPLGNQGWDWNRPSSYSPEDTDTANDWSPIYNSKEFHDDSQGYPDSHYKMSASETAPIRVSVKKTVTTKT